MDGAREADAFEKHKSRIGLCQGGGSSRELGGLWLRANGRARRSVLDLTNADRAALERKGPREEQRVEAAVSSSAPDLPSAMP